MHTVSSICMYMIQMQKWHSSIEPVSDKKNSFTVYFIYRVNFLLYFTKSTFFIILFFQNKSVDSIMNIILSKVFLKKFNCFSRMWCERMLVDIIITAMKYMRDIPERYLNSYGEKRTRCNFILILTHPFQMLFCYLKIIGFKVERT